MSWGSELWDKYSELTHHAQNGIDFLEYSVASFIKERGKIEAEYAKSLRALVKKYSPKDGNGAAAAQSAVAVGNGGTMEANRRRPDEFTHMRAYKQMLNEVGFQANQHEILADNFTKEQYKGVHEAAKRLKEHKKRNMKEAEKIGAELKQAYKTMDSCREKFRKAFDEQERAEATFAKANADGSVTKNEVAKLQHLASKTSQACDAAKGKYASQLVKTNEFQSRYYRELLPRVLDGLEALEKERVSTVQNAFLRVVSKEKEVNPIVCRCHEAIEAAMRGVSPDEDALAVVERFKSGDVPPGDFKFEDMSDPQAMLAQDALEKPTNLNLYPKKRELERGIEETEAALNRKRKELASLEQMVATYKSNPKFGNSKHFQEEIAHLRREMEEMERALNAMRANRANIEEQLDALRSRSPMVPSPMNRHTIQRGSQGSSSTGTAGTSSSLKSSSLSIGSGSHTLPNRGAQHLMASNGMVVNSASASPEGSDGQPPIYDSVPGDRENIYNDDNWDDGFDPPPPPFPNQQGGGDEGGVVFPLGVAMYPYEGPDLQESNIPMAKGEEFEVVEGDSDGWTRVRRLRASPNGEAGDEGYVPTSFLDVISR